MKSSTTAALLAFFLGCLGADCFYLGRTGAGIARIVLTILFLPASVIWSLFSMVKYLSDGVAVYASDSETTELPDYVWGWHWARYNDSWFPTKFVSGSEAEVNLPEIGDVITIRRADGSTSDRQVMDVSYNLSDDGKYAVITGTNSK